MTCCCYTGTGIRGTSILFHFKFCKCQRSSFIFLTPRNLIPLWESQRRRKKGSCPLPHQNQHQQKNSWYTDTHTSRGRIGQGQNSWETAREYQNRQGVKNNPGIVNTRQRSKKLVWISNMYIHCTTGRKGSRHNKGQENVGRKRP